MTFNQKKFASDILQKRIDNNLSMDEAAMEADVARTTLRLLEMKLAHPNISTLCLVCGWLGVNPGVYFE